MRNSTMIQELRERARITLGLYHATIDEIVERQSKSEPPAARDSRDSEPDSEPRGMTVDVHASQ